MGFSVSGSFAIILVASIVAFGMFHTATTNGFEEVSDAQTDRTDRTLAQQNTAVELATAEWNRTTETLTVTARNAGTTELAVADVDLLADNAYLSGYATSVDGDASTGLWLPQENLTMADDSLDGDPGRVKVVTGPGVAVVAETTEVS